MIYLIIDDDPLFGEILSSALTRRGYRAISAVNGTEALEYCRNSVIDRVILDLKLHEESGLLILQQLREHIPEAEIVILTGYSSISTAVKAIQMGALNYLCKPASVDEIIAAFNSPDEAKLTPLQDRPPSVKRLQWEHIQRVLNANGGNISATARSLGMHRRTLQRKLQKRPVKQ